MSNSYQRAASVTGPTNAVEGGMQAEAAVVVPAEAAVHIAVLCILCSFTHNQDFADTSEG
jgi:hypothetical protein